MTAKMMRSMRRFAEDSSGTTAVEYAVVAVGIAVAIAFAVSQVGDAVDAMYLAVGAAIP